MARERGSGITPPRVVELLKNEVAKKSMLAVSDKTGLGLAAIGRYLKGKGEPTTATLEKLASYFGVSVAWLRGESNLSYEEIYDLMQSCGFGVPVEKVHEITVKIMAAFAQHGISLPDSDPSKRAEYIKTVKVYAAREADTFLYQHPNLGLHKIGPYDRKTTGTISDLVKREYSGIHAHNVISILRLSEEENLKLAKLIDENFDTGMYPPED